MHSECDAVVTTVGVTAAAYTLMSLTMEESFNVSLYRCLISLLNMEIQGTVSFPRRAGVGQKADKVS